MYKVLFVTSVPSPSRVEFFNILGKDPDIDLTVVFMESEKEQHHRSQKWFKNNVFENFKYIYLNRRIGFKKKQYFGYASVDILQYLKSNYDEIIFAGYAYPTFMLGMQSLIIKKIPYSIEVDGGFIAQDSVIKKKIKSYFISHASRWYSSGAGTDKYLKFYGAKTNGIVRYPFTSISLNDLCRAWDCSKTELSELINNAEMDPNIWKNRRNFLRIKGKDYLKINKDKNILAIGQFVHRKGFDVLLKAACEIDTEIGITIVGGKAPVEYTEFVNNNNLRNVNFVDFLTKDELKYYFWMADLFVMPTRVDIWGLVINEAMAYGLPIVSTDRCLAALELVKEGENGYIVPTENVSELQNAIRDFFSKDKQAMGIQSFKMIQGHTIECMANRHIEVWKG